MAYGLRYILRYETEIYKSDFRILISQNGYLGDPEYKKIGAGRVSLSKNNDGKISGTSLNFSIQSDTNFEYAYFFGTDNKGIKVELEYKGTKIWTGFNVSDQYSEPYVAPPYDVNLVATDGLGLLKTEKFELTGMVSRFTAIRYCMDKIGLNLGYLINIVLHEIHEDPPYINMMEKLYFHSEIFSGKTCYEVLQLILPEEVTITQHLNRWLIERNTDLGNYRYRYTYAGVYENSSTEQKINKLGTVAQSKVFGVNGDLTLYPIGNLNLEFRPAWKNFTIRQTFGIKKSFLDNYDFKSGTDNWLKSTSSDTFSVISLQDGTFGLIKGQHSTDAVYVYNSVKLKSTTQITVEINYCPIAYHITMFTGLQAINVDVKFRIILKNTQSLTDYYLTTTGWKSGTLTADQKTVLISNIQTSLQVETVDFKSLKIIASKLPEDGTLEIELFQVILKGTDITNPNVNLLGLAVKDVLVYSQDLTLFQDVEETKVLLNSNSTLEGDVIDICPVDLPLYDNAEHIFKNINFYFDGSDYKPTTGWTGEEFSYLNYVALFIAEQYSIPRHILKGQLAGKDIGLNNAIVHDLNESKKFYIKTGTWNIIEDTVDVELVETVFPQLLLSPQISAQFNPNTSYAVYPELNDFRAVGNEGSYNHSIDGSYEIIIPDQANPVVVSRKETITPYQLDYDSGLPQFSIKDSLVETNVGNAANALRIQEGQLISHNYGSMNRSEIANVKNMGETYNPTRTWNIAQTDITLEDNTGYFLYLKVPLDE